MLLSAQSDANTVHREILRVQFLRIKLLSACELSAIIQCIIDMIVHIRNFTTKIVRPHENFPLNGVLCDVIGYAPYNTQCILVSVRFYCT